jgi:hypothetical protein
VLLDVKAFDRHAQQERALATGTPVVGDAELDETAAKRMRAMRHALAEYELKTYVIEPNRPLGEMLS